MRPIWFQYIVIQICVGKSYLKAWIWYDIYYWYIPGTWRKERSCVQKQQHDDPLRLEYTASATTQQRASSQKPHFSWNLIPKNSLGNCNCHHQSVSSESPSCGGEVLPECCCLTPWTEKERTLYRHVASMQKKKE